MVTVCSHEKVVRVTTTASPPGKGTAVTCTLNNLQNQTEYYFVVRSFDGSIISANSNEVHFVPPAVSTSSAPAPTNGVLASKFAESTLTGGVEYYTDRSYQLTGVPSSYNNMDAIITPNDDRNRTEASGYLTFTMPYAGTVYVALRQPGNPCAELDERFCQHR